MNIPHMNIKMRSKIYWLAALPIAILAIAALQHARAADPQKKRRKRETSRRRRGLLSGRPEDTHGDDG